MKIINVDLGIKKYDIIIENGILRNAGEEIREVYKGTKLAVITDDNVYSLYKDDFSKELEKSGFSPKFIVMKPGERSKSLESAEFIYSKLIEYGITRGDMIAAFGGGVIGDLAGFAAATYLRGLDYVQIPTSLLAQIDSSIGGKVAVNLKQGKNLVGSFYQPRKVIIDPNLLNTLSDKYIKDGLGEVIKYACIRDQNFFNMLKNIKSKEVLFNKIEDIIHTCCNIKKHIVEKDEKDNDIRMILNFGHTLGHAIEKYYNYETYTHGEAVALGMYYITKKSEELGYTLSGTSELIKEILVNYNINYEIINLDMERIRNAIILDKKNISGKINLILLKKIGNCFIQNIPIENLNNYF